MKARLLFGLVVAAQMVVLYAPEAPAGMAALPFADTLLHAVVFAAAVWSGRLAGLPVFALVAVFAVQAGVSEVVQEALLPGRTGNVGDVAADLAGIALGALLPWTRVGHGTAENTLGTGSMDSERTRRDEGGPADER